MGTFSIWHWIIVLAIVILVFGTKKLRNLGGDLGSALKGFKDGMKESDSDTSPQSAQINDQVIDVEARKESPAATFKESTKEEHRAPVNAPASPTPASKAATESDASQPTGVNSQITDAEIKDKTQVKA